MDFCKKITPFVKDVPEESFKPDFESDPNHRMVGFEFTLIINPETPL
jgi:hypothetical protein